MRAIDTLRNTRQIQDTETLLKTTPSSDFKKRFDIFMDKQRDYQMLVKIIFGNIVQEVNFERKKSGE